MIESTKARWWGWYAWRRIGPDCGKRVWRPTQPWAEDVARRTWS